MELLSRASGKRRSSSSSPSLGESSSTSSSSSCSVISAAYSRMHTYTCTYIYIYVYTYIRNSANFIPCMATSSSASGSWPQWRTLHIMLDETSPFGCQHQNLALSLILLVCLAEVHNQASSLQAAHSQSLAPPAGNFNLPPASWCPLVHGAAFWPTLWWP